MKNPLWAIAMALPLMLGGCSSKEESNTTAEAPATRVPKSDEVVSTSPTQQRKFTSEQKENLRAAVMKLAQVNSDGKAIPVTLTTDAWNDVLGKDLPLDYVRCRVKSAQQPCHLHVEPVGPLMQGKPARWLRFETNDDGTYWASIRSGGKASERMECKSLIADAGFMSGYCDIAPHSGGSGTHWVQFGVFVSTTGRRDSVYFSYEDSEPMGGGGDVEDGTGHGDSL